MFIIVFWGFNPRNITSLHYNNNYLCKKKQKHYNTHIFIVLHGESFDWGHLVRKRWSLEKKVTHMNITH